MLPAKPSSTSRKAAAGHHLRRRRQPQQFSIGTLRKRQQTSVAGLRQIADAPTHRNDLLVGHFVAVDRQANNRLRRKPANQRVCLLSLAVVGALSATGIILTIAMLIAPGAIAFLLTRQFAVMLGVAVAVAVSASLLGVYLSFFLDSASAPTIVLLLTLAFVAAFARSGCTMRAETVPVAISS